MPQGHEDMKDRKGLVKTSCQLMSQRLCGKKNFPITLSHD